MKFNSSSTENPLLAVRYSESFKSHIVTHRTKGVIFAGSENQCLQYIKVYKYQQELALYRI